jgi:formylglycine-generating enzyme required for sulfatase activity
MVTNPPPILTNMVRIAGGDFVMGGTTNVGHSESSSDELPQHTVTISQFDIDIYEVSKALWDEVIAWNGGNGYSYSNPGFAKGPTYPVTTINWFDAVKWCNARSEMEGLTPVYYTDLSYGTVYKTGEGIPVPDWSANGFRLPTEAEWERAARGGAADHRFPWSDVDTIDHTRANYFHLREDDVPVHAYDMATTEGFNPTFFVFPPPPHAPVDSFAPNGYGIYQMAGNVMEWCWDWYYNQYYAGSPSTDPKGPAGPLTFRVLRGGAYGNEAVGCRTAARYSKEPDENAFLAEIGEDYFGFRCVRRP